MKEKSLKTITKSGRSFDKKRLDRELSWVRKLNWNEVIWTSQKALIDTSDGSSQLFVNQTFDENSFDLVEDGWIHDHCDVCFQDIRDQDKCAISDSQIICILCFTDFVEIK